MDYYQNAASGQEASLKVKKTGRTVTVVFVLIMLIALGLSFIPFLLTRSVLEEEMEQIRPEGCTETIYAVVVRNETREVHDEDGDFTEYTPVYKYKYNGESYEVRSVYNSNMIRYQPGTEVELMIDPGDPMHIYDPGTRKIVNQGYMLTLIFPAATLVGAAVAGIFLYGVRKMLADARAAAQGGSR
ncbi:MAG: DUF3592 domain-containing protein [Oscillospiraceae bacterium]|nr:DUF3592 domain-containing protein [Oscillospiraceae bacterium]